LPGAAEISNAKWIEVKQLQNPASLLAAQQKQALGLGEISTILLANSVRILCCSMTTRHACLPRPKAQILGSVGLLEAFTPGAI
jgi:predicted nucleic acid-binding protein